MRRAAALAVLLLMSACAAKPAPMPPTVTAPKFPDYIQPIPPPDLGTPAAVERHHVGWQWLQAGDLRAAERNFNSALKQSPTFYPAEVGLGYVALANKKLKDALLHFDRAVVANPRYAPALAARAEVLLATGETEEAEQSIEAALKESPNLGSLRSRLEVLRFRTRQADISRARQLAESGNLDEARGAYLIALEASPDSPFLLRELAEVERRAGNAETALGYAKRATEMEPDEPRGHVILGELYESQGDLGKAADAYSAAVSLLPDEALSEKIEGLRSRAAFAAMPEEYRAIESAETVTRAQLAALLAVRLEPLLSKSRRVNAVVITDTRNNWASNHILSVARAGVMEVYPNHTFQPDAIVRRGDLALAVSSVLDLVAANHPQLAAAWRRDRRKFPDVSQQHFSYPAVALAVEAGVMAPLDDGSFQPTRPITGIEAITAVEKLQELGGRPAR